MNSGSRNMPHALLLLILLAVFCPAIIHAQAPCTLNCDLLFGQDCRTIEDKTIRDCDVQCVGEACDGLTFIRCQVSGSNMRAKEYRDSTVICTSCFGGEFHDSTVTCTSCTHNLLVQDPELSRPRFWRSDVTCTDCRRSIFYDSTVNCNNCDQNSYFRSHITWNQGRLDGLSSNNKMFQSQVECAVPPRPNQAGICGNFQGACSCCRGEGCLATSVTYPLCEQEGFCAQIQDAESGLTCEDRRNPFCTRDIPNNGEHLGANWGEPHIDTMDGLAYECHVPGEHILLRSENREIHGLFEVVSDELPLTITTAVGVTSPLLASSPKKFQMYISSDPQENADTIEVGGCSISMYENFFQRNEGYFDLSGYLDIRILPDLNEIRLNFPSLGVFMFLYVEKYIGICYFSVFAKLFGTYNHGNLEGLLGNANFDVVDDWKNVTTGETIPLPDAEGLLTQAAYDYCAQWCVTEKGDSLFEGRYSSSASWNEIQRCSTPYVNPFPSDGRRLLDNCVDSAEIQLICQGDISCLMDGCALGGEAARAHFVRKAQLMQMRAELVPGPSRLEPSGTPSITPSWQSSSKPSVLPSSTPSLLPSFLPSVFPSSMPSDVPSPRPSLSPSTRPSLMPSAIPSGSPSSVPSFEPTLEASPFPTDHPNGSSLGPSVAPTFHPTSIPSTLPTLEPSMSQSEKPSMEPSFKSLEPSLMPSQFPTVHKSKKPGMVPSWRSRSGSGSAPTAKNPLIPSDSMAKEPLEAPRRRQSLEPTAELSFIRSGDGPVSEPSPIPSIVVSVHPRKKPTMAESFAPSVGQTSSPVDMSISDPTYESSSSPSTGQSLSQSSETRSAPSSTGAAGGFSCLAIVFVVVVILISGP